MSKFVEVQRTPLKENYGFGWCKNLTFSNIGLYHYCDDCANLPFYKTGASFTVRGEMI